MEQKRAAPQPHALLVAPRPGAREIRMKPARTAPPFRNSHEQE